MHFPFASSEVRVNVECRLFLSDLLVTIVGCTDGLHTFAVEPADQKLEDLGVLREKTEVICERTRTKTKSLAEPLMVGQKGFVDAVTFAFWPNIDIDHIANQAAFRFC